MALHELRIIKVPLSFSPKWSIEFCEFVLAIHLLIAHFFCIVSIFHLIWNQIVSAFLLFILTPDVNDLLQSLEQHRMWWFLSVRLAIPQLLQPALIIRLDNFIVWSIAFILYTESGLNRIRYDTNGLDWGISATAAVVVVVVGSDVSPINFSLLIPQEFCNMIYVLIFCS